MLCYPFQPDTQTKPRPEDRGSYNLQLQKHPNIKVSVGPIRFHQTESANHIRKQSLGSESSAEHKVDDALTPNPACPRNLETASSKRESFSGGYHFPDSRFYFSFLSSSSFSDRYIYHHTFSISYVWETKWPWQHPIPSSASSETHRVSRRIPPPPILGWVCPPSETQPVKGATLARSGA